ncbi:MAG TPA: ubiquinone/menaquinone biosynthesis methyltransferase [Gemmatimonadales bacterium]
MLASDRELPLAGGSEKRAYVRDVFTAIAPTYDRLNRIISLRLDQRWRRTAVAGLEWRRNPEGIYLDLCAGTLDLAAMLAGRPGFRGRVIGADFVPAMLRRGREKSSRVAPVGADALELPFPDAAFDGGMVGWGLRNLADLDAGLTEAARVLKPGARLVALDMSLPAEPLLRRAYLVYFRRVLPWIGRRISKHTTAYTWLPASTVAFPDPPELARRMEAAGFGGVSYRRFMGGVCALHVGTRAGARD